MKFKDIKFEKRRIGGIQARVELKDEMILSIVAGEFAYSSPRADFGEPEQFESFEIAIIDKDGDFVTREHLAVEHNDVLGWVSREQIEEIIANLAK